MKRDEEPRGGKRRPFRMVCLSLAFACLPAVSAEEEAEGISFFRQIRPIFQSQCHGCHQPAKARGGYVMSSFDSLLKGGDSGYKAVIPRNPEESYLVELITPVDGVADMPRKADPLSEVQIGLIRQWIAQGARDDTPEGSRRRYDAGNPPVYLSPPAVTSLDHSPDGSLLAVAGFHEVLLHHADGSGIAARLVGLSARIESVRFSPDGKRLAATGGQPAQMGEVQIWDVEKRELALSVPVSYDTVFGASWSPDGRYVAFGCTDTTLRAIDTETGEEVVYQGAHDDWVLDTVFSADGSHLVSVGRDQTAKLTEFATQRFVDNITSITPGALKGGILSVARHPQRDEILVGGADGTPQIYRMIRKTKRVIGDNANLMRRFPSMPGRVFGVDYHPDGKRIVAGSSLDGSGTVNIYESDFDGSLGERLAGIMQKTSTSRSAEERALVEEYRTRDVSLAASTSLPAGIYAVDWDPSGNTIAAAGGDGLIRILDARDASLAGIFHAAPVEREGEDPVIALSVDPQRIELAHPYDYVQLVISSWKAGRPAQDVTRSVSLSGAGDILEVSGSGMVRAKADGEGVVRVEHQGRVLEIPARVSGQDRPFEADYITHVMPVISALGCNTGTCHGSKDGRNGFKLSLRGYDPIFDVRALVDDHAARRINPASPEHSLMLLKATAQVPHEGGERTRPGEDYYQILEAWIGQGARLDLESSRVAGIRIHPSNPVVEAIGEQQQMRVVATYSDGSVRDVTAEAFLETGNGEVAETGEDGLVTSVRRGEAPLLARFEGAYAATTLTVMGDRSGFVWDPPETYNPVDEFAAAKWKRMKILPSELSADGEFLRRVHLDLTGLPPSAAQVREFLADPRPSREKREARIDALVGNGDYVDYWSNKWADLLQVNRKFLGASGAQTFRDWIRREVEENTPYDQFVRKILTARGSNRENPEASYYKILREPEAIMENTTHLFLATRFNCNKCHDHPFERWTQDQYYEMSAYFARLGLRRDPESKDQRVGGTAVEGAKPLYEEVYDRDQGEVIHQRTGQIAPPAFPYPATVSLENPEESSRRDLLAAWITSPDNHYFARSYVNRLWGYLMGVGIIEPIDDIRAGNPPSNPELLDWLAEEFVSSGFDVQHMVRTICKSRTYQLSVRTNQWNEDDDTNFSHATPKRLSAEVLYDAIHFATGTPSSFPGVPRGTRAAALPDSGIKLEDGFLANLGRPPRESACECERSNDMKLGSIMSLVSGPTVDQALSDPDNALARLVEETEEDAALAEELYLRILNRFPRPEEVERAGRILGRMQEEHQDLERNLADYRKSIAAEEERRAQRRQTEIRTAEERLAAYQREAAPRVEEAQRKRKEAIAEAEMRLEEHRQGLPDALASWEAAGSYGSAWHPLDPSEMKASNQAELVLQRDLSIFATGPGGKGSYEITCRSELGALTGLRLEALADDRLPEKGPGRAGNGNFVVSEIEMFWAPADSPGERKQARLEKARASHSQGSYPVASAINGQVRPSNDGWAISPQMGKSHQAVFEVKDAVGQDGPILVTVRIRQEYQDGEHALGRFRLSLTASPKPVDFGVPDPVLAVLETDPAQRTKEQETALLEFFEKQDPELRKLERALAEASKELAQDPRLSELNQALEEARRPLPEDPRLRDLRRAVGLSARQLENRRLTAAQDLAWALINNPAFLFNY